MSVNPGEREWCVSTKSRREEVRDAPEDAVANGEYWHRPISKHGGTNETGMTHGKWQYSSRDECAGTETGIGAANAAAEGPIPAEGVCECLRGRHAEVWDEANVEQVCAARNEARIDHVHSLLLALTARKVTQR